MQKDTDKKNEKELFLTCEKCFHQNEKERVYCHNCGEKLDRSVLPKPEETKEWENPEQTQKRVKKLMDPRRGWLRRDSKIFIKIIVFAAIVASFVLFWQTPDFVPQMSPEAIPNRDASDLWRRAIAAKTAVTIEITDPEINYHLSRMLKATESSVPGFKFERTFVHCESGVITIFAQYSLWGFPMYGSVSYHPAVNDGVFTAEVVAVRLGRLGVDPKVKVVGEYALASVFKSLEEDTKQLNRLAQVVVGEGTITFTTKPQP
ncbi:MAG: hypothetical protein WCK17_18665 [Verrucomicrobiota bacterium]